jgi:hypothetical protein
MVTHKWLSEFCLLANKEILNFYESRSSCVFSTAVVCDAMSRLGIKAEPLRVTAGVFPDAQDKYASILGGEGNGERQPASEPNMWKGHLVSLVEDRFLVDTTLDQVNDVHPHLGAVPCVIYLPDTEWGKPSHFPGYCWTGLLSLFPGATVRYSKIPRQNGWKHAGDFRPCRRKEIVERLIRLACALETRPRGAGERRSSSLACAILNECFQGV